MPRLRPDSTKIQFASSTEMPWLIYRACLATGTISNTAYLQQVVAQALSRDLGIPLEEILANIPPNRGPSNHLYNPKDGTMVRYPRKVGPGNTIEEVK